MTDKERVEEIDVVHYEEDEDGNNFVLLKEDDYWFLKEQAERVQELEEDLRLSEQEEKRRWKENNRYREALEFYADSKKYHVETSYDVENEICGFGSIGKVIVDHGKTAREALEESLNGDR